MSMATEALCQGPRTSDIFGSDHQDDARDESVRLLLEFGARVSNRTNNPCVSRIIREALQIACMPQLLNDAIVGVAVVRQLQHAKPRPPAA
jgi:hypothetical protein